VTEALNPGEPSAAAGIDADASLTPAGERLLSAASDLFYRRGIRAVGVDLIAEVAGTTKKTLYDRFGSKDALVALYLRRRADRWHRFAQDHLDQTVPDPGSGRVLAVFDALQLWVLEQDRGCAFVNAYAEIGGTDHPAIPVIRADKAWMRDLFSDLTRDADIEGADRLGAQLHLLFEGAIVALTTGNHTDAIDQARDAATRLLQEPDR
jgi:AcrR family transcriptional regulator